MRKLYEVELFGKVWKLELVKTHYSCFGNLAIEAYTESGEDFATLTVNLGPGIGPDEAFIDTNNCPWAEELLRSNGIAKPTGETRSSGFCIYPLYRFNAEALESMRSYD